MSAPSPLLSRSASESHLPLPATTPNQTPSALAKRVQDCFYWTTLSCGLLLGGAVGTVIGASFGIFRLGCSCNDPAGQDPVDSYVLLACAGGGAAVGAFAGMEVADKVAKEFLKKG